MANNEPWDGRPDNPDRNGWHLLRRIARPEFNICEQEVPWLYIPGAIYPYNGAAVTPWHITTPNGGGHVYEEREMGRDWTYVGPMKVCRPSRARHQKQQ